MCCTYDGGQQQVGRALPFVRYRSTGKERDSESGNDYFGARYYASSMGRWMSPDTDMTLKRILPYPQRWNRYAYVINNPLVRFDPVGLSYFYIYLANPAGTTPILQGKNRMPDWKAMDSRAQKFGNHIYVRSGDDANAANYQKDLKLGGVTVFVGHDSSFQLTATDSPVVHGSILNDGSIVGSRVNQSVTTNGVTYDSSMYDAMVTPVSANGGTVAVFGCSSIGLDSIYSGANTFIGVNSGADQETSIDGLMGAAGALVGVLSTNGSVTDAQAAAQQQLNQDPHTDSGDQVVVKQHQ